VEAAANAARGRFAGGTGRAGGGGPPFQFKEAIKDVHVPEKHEDRYLLRFLRARKWDLPKAEQMFRSTLAFRQQWRLDTIVDEYKPPQVRRRRRRPGSGCRPAIAAPWHG